jgi:beta-glucosidase/6-phospho-beta-glucosidase/beta-galactosidase
MSRFPRGFFWGGATAANQIEGASAEVIRTHGGSLGG